MRPYHVQLQLHYDAPATYVKAIVASEGVSGEALAACESFATQGDRSSYVVIVREERFGEFGGHVSNVQAGLTSVLVQLGPDNRRLQQRRILERMYGKAAAEADALREASDIVVDTDALKQLLLPGAIVHDKLTKASVPFTAVPLADSRDGVRVFFPLTHLALVQKILGDLNAF